MNNVFGWLLAIFLLFILLTLDIKGKRNFDLEQQLENKQITTREYCNVITNNGTNSTSIPIKCYQIYNMPNF